MDIPECYGKGIYEYWKLKKDSIKILANGIAHNNPFLKIFGGFLTGVFSARDIYNILVDRGEKVVLPKEECNDCRHLKGCLLSALSLIGDEINEELKEK